MIMTQVQPLFDLATTTVLLSSRRVSVTDLQSALKETLPPVFVEKICSAKQCAQDIATTATYQQFFHIYVDFRRTHKQIRNALEPDRLMYLFETFLLELHTHIEEFKRCGEANVCLWFYNENIRMDVQHVRHVSQQEQQQLGSAWSIWWPMPNSNSVYKMMCLYVQSAND